MSADSEWHLYLSARQSVHAFESLLLDLNYTNVNELRAKRREKYGKDLSEFPERLNLEVKRLLNYRKQEPENWQLEDAADEDEDNDEDDWSEKPGPYDHVRVAKRRQLREDTATRLEKIICRLYGFLEKRGETVVCLQDLFDKRRFLLYKKFLKKDRLLSNRGIFNVFSILIGTARQYVSLAGADWYAGFMRQLETDSIEEERKQRRKRACVSFERFQAIPDEIHKKVKALRKRRPWKTDAGSLSAKAIQKRIALLEMQEFLIRWVLELPWPSRNLCECRVKPHDGSPNLFKDELPSDSTILLPPFAQKRKEDHPKAKVWQFHFSEKETSGCGEVQMVIPELLITRLEKYLRDTHREFPETLKRRDPREAERRDPPETLFVNSQGNPLTPHSLHLLFLDISLQYTGEPIGPQVFRDIWSFHFLKKNEDSFVDLALCLWQLDPLMTEILYGRGRVTQRMRDRRRGRPLARR